jgi:hypothetical protein
MRILLAVTIWVLFVGGLSLYMHRLDRAVSGGPGVVEPERAAGDYTIVVTPGFAVEPDPFALATDDSETPPALIVRLGGEEIYRSGDRLGGGRPIMIEPGENLVIGSNEIYVEASPPADEYDMDHAVRVQVLRDETAVAEETFWAGGGNRVTGALQFILTREPAEDDHGH